MTRFVFPILLSAGLLAGSAAAFAQSAEKPAAANDTEATGAHPQTDWTGGKDQPNIKGAGTAAETDGKLPPPDTAAGKASDEPGPAGTEASETEDAKTKKN